MSPDLPPSALQVLEEARESFAERPIMLAWTSKLDPFSIRRALATARREAADDQTPAVLYGPKSGEALVILEPEELAGLLERAEAGEEGEEAGKAKAQEEGEEA